MSYLSKLHCGFVTCAIFFFVTVTGVLPSDADEWIQMYSRPTVAEALALADEYHDRFGSNVAVFECLNGWYVGVLGPYATGGGAMALARLSGIVPVDSFVTSKTRCGTLVSAGGANGGAPAVQDQRSIAEAAVQRYYSDWSLPNREALANVACLFQASILYFGKITSRDAVLAEKIEFAIRWPERSYVIRPGTLVSGCTTFGTCHVDGIVDWRAYSADRDSTSIGSASFAIEFSSLNPPVISAEDSKVLSRQVFSGRSETAVPSGSAAEEPEKASLSSGSGFAISIEGAVVTNAHVVKDCKAIDLVGIGPASVLAIDDERDLAVVRAPRQLPSAATIQQAQLKLGQQIVALGFPLADVMGNALTVSPGVVSSLSGFGGEAKRYSVSANIQPGNSGGPILNLNGEVVGVAVAKLNEVVMLKEKGTSASNIGFAIPVGTLRDFLAPFKSSMTETPPSTEGVVEDAAERARGFTYQIICHS